MSNILLTCSSDSLAAKVIEKLGVNNPVIIEPSTNCKDVYIVITICICIFLIVLIGVVGFLAWKQIDHQAKKKVDEKKREWDVKDKDYKQAAEEKNRKWQLEDEERKRKVAIEDEERRFNFDLLEKYLNHLKEQLQNEQNVSNVTQYRQVLEYFIELSQKGELSKISKEMLDKFFEQPK